jgi:hypothetical protein
MKMLLRVAVVAAAVALNRTEAVLIKNGCRRAYNSTLCTQTGTNITSASSLNTFFIHFCKGGDCYLLICASQPLAFRQ